MVGIANGKDNVDPAMSSLLVRGVSVLDVATGDTVVQDVGIADGVVVEPAATGDAPTVVDGSGLTMMFGLWDCHAHPGSLMYDPSGQGFFEGPAEWTVRAGANLMAAARMGVTGVRAVAEANRIDIAWSKAFAGGSYPGPRVKAAGAGLRTTGGHGTAFPRRPVEVEWEWAVDGADAMLRAARALIEQGVDWIKLMLTGGLYSEHESVDDPQFTPAELDAVMTAANGRGVPVAAHCGSGRVAEMFARAGGRSIEHGYALDEAAAAGDGRARHLAGPDDRCHPRHRHDDRRRLARTRAGQGGRLRRPARRSPAFVSRRRRPDRHRRRPQPHRAALARRATDAGTRWDGQALGAASRHHRWSRPQRSGGAHRPVPGAAADLILVDGDPLADPMALRNPVGVITFGRLIVDPTVGRTDKFGAVGRTDKMGTVGGTDKFGTVGRTDKTSTVGPTDEMGTVGGTDKTSAIGPVG